MITFFLAKVRNLVRTFVEECILRLRPIIAARGVCVTARDDVSSALQHTLDYMQHPFPQRTVVPLELF
jgi:hypothetical protein